MTLRSYARLALVPTTLVAAGCPGDDTAATASADSSGSSESSGGSTVTQTTSETMTTSMSTTMSTTEADTSSGSTEESSSTDVTQGSTESSSDGSSSGPSESSSTTEVEQCGNDMIDGAEECDGADLGGADCTDVGFDAGTLGCNAGCVYDTFNCIIYICGNNSIDPTELCDGTDLAGADCASEGFPLGGELSCTGACDDYDVSGCLTQLCGNDTLEGTEVCDGANLNGASCASEGFVGGTLGCSGSCLGYSYSECIGGGDQFAYVVNDTFPNSITAYSVDPSGALTELPGSPFDTGGGSSFDHHPNALANCGPYMYAANFGSANISAFVVEGDGSLTTIAGSPFALTNVVSLACDDSYLFASTFDGNVHRFTIESDGALTFLGSTGAGASTLGMSVDVATERLFVAGWSSTQNVFDIDGAGNLTAVAGSPFFHGGSNHSSVVSPDGAFVASEGNGGVRIWSVAGNGAIAEVAGSPFTDTSGCEVVGLAWAPDSSRVFAGHRGCIPGVVSVYDVTAGTGALTEVTGSPFPTGENGAISIAVDPTGSRIFVSHSGGTGVSVLDVAGDGSLTPVTGSPFANGVAGTHATIVLRGGGGQSCQVPFAEADYDAAVTFADAPGLTLTRMPIAWDGVEYWASSGGNSDVDNIAELDASGAVIAYYNPGYDLRSAFTKGDGIAPIYYRAYDDGTIHVQTGPGTWADDVALEGGVPDSQSAVVWDDINRYFLAHSNGTVTRWDESGALVDSIALIGWGTQGSELGGIQARGRAWACGYFYTYSDGILSAWDEGGNRVATTTLNGASTSSDAYYSYSIANGLFFVNSGAGGTWQGYDAI